MKKLLIPILLLLSVNVLGQQNCDHSEGCLHPIGILRKNTDTLKIKYSPSIKFIKFGDRVYEVVQPTLKEVDPVNTWTPSGLYNPVPMPSYHINPHYRTLEYKPFKF